MKLKDFHLMINAMYDVVMQNEDIAEIVRVAGVCYVYDVVDNRNHAVLLLSDKRQLNAMNLKEHGINANDNLYDCHFLFRVDRQTKQLYF